jgi:hypothetical protein
LDTKYPFLKIALNLFPFTYIFFLPSWLLVTRWVSAESGIVYPSRTAGLIRPLRIILFDTVVGLSYLSCQIALYSLNNPSVIFLREQLVSSFYVLCTMSPVSWNCPFWITQFRFFLPLNTFNGYFFNQKCSFPLISGLFWFFLRLHTFNGYFFNQKWSFPLISGLIDFSYVYIHSMGISLIRNEVFLWSVDFLGSNS